MNQGMTIGILGAGRFGAALARRAVSAGHRVSMARSRTPSSDGSLAEPTVPGVPQLATEQLRGSDLIVVAVPLHKYRSIDASVLGGHMVIDTMNYWPPVDGVMEEFESGSTSQVIEDFLGDVKLIKTLNHISARDLDSDAEAGPARERRALLVASDHDDAKHRTAVFLHSLGYDAVDAGPLSAGRVMESGSSMFQGRYTAEEAQALLAGRHHIRHLN